MNKKQLNLVAQIDIEAAKETQDEATPKNRRFTMTAYTGGIMNLAGWRYPVVVDLAGLTVGDSYRPIFINHNKDVDDLVGQTDQLEISEGQLLAGGEILGDSPRVQRVINLADKGFRWQASIGARVDQVEFIREGREVTVNGQSFVGPLNVARKSALGEISFVMLAADGNTSAAIAAGEQLQEMAMDNQDQQKTQQNNDNTQSVQTTTTVQESAKPDTPDVVQDIRARAATETRRIAAIHKICKSEHADIEAQAIADGWDETKTELEVLRASRPTAPASHNVKSNNNPLIFEAVALMASGANTKMLEASYDHQILEAADKLRGVGIQEFCERVVGQPLPRFKRDASGWLQAAFSTMSLPGILSNVANKMLLDGYNYVEDAWRRICKIASVNDFKEHTRYRMTSNFKFLPVGPDGEIKHGKLDEQTFAQKADTHGIMFALTRQMIINDDLGAFTDIPRQIGMGAAEAIADAVWSLLLSNPGSFFSTGHKNYAAGADTALSVDGLTAAEVLFLEQTKPNGRPLGILPSILLVPIALKVTAEILMKSVKLNETTYVDTTAKKSSPKPSDNPHAGKFEVVSSSYLGNPSFTGASSKAWYLFADPNRLPAMEVAFLNGMDRPTVEKTDADFNTLGIQFRGYIDFGVREQDYRGGVKMKGEA